MNHIKILNTLKTIVNTTESIIRNVQTPEPSSQDLNATSDVPLQTLNASNNNDVGFNLPITVNTLQMLCSTLIF